MFPRTKSKFILLTKTDKKNVLKLLQNIGSDDSTFPTTTKGTKPINIRNWMEEAFKILASSQYYRTYN
jgi:hypothetical protein